MIKAILFSVVLLVGCIGSSDAPPEYPVCSDLGCTTDVFCTGEGLCVCDTMKCTISPTCEAIGCDPSAITCGGFSKAMCSCPIDGVDTKCTVLQPAS